jgi:hypothetical protein
VLYIDKEKENEGERIVVIYNNITKTLQTF